MNAAVPLPAAQADAQRFLLLDLMRGIAALAVLVYHGVDYLGVQALPNAYLAVDMFFLLSGFVIAHNYDRKIAAGMPLTDFAVQRLIRLHPCLLLALVLGVAMFVLREGREHGYLDLWRTLGAAGLNALYLPAFIQPYHENHYFPYVGAAWSLTFELFANIVYWLSFRLLNKTRLALLLVVSAGVLSVGLVRYGTVDLGMRPWDLAWGIPRVMLGFFLGVALRRHLYTRMLAIRLTPAAAAPLAVAVLLAAFSSSRLVSPGLVGLADFGVDLVVFPALLFLVGAVHPRPVTAVFCKLTGDASYPVYLLQGPLMAIVAGVPQALWGIKAAVLAPWPGLAYVALTVLVALWVDRFVELPVRRWLKERWQAFKGRTSVTPAPAS